MKWEFIEKATLGHLIMRRNDGCLKGDGMLNGKTKGVNTFIFNKSEAQQVVIDEIEYTMPPRSVLPLVCNQHFSFERPEALVAWQFNREFYCIVEHDAEVGCAGFLFYGIHHPLFISLPPEEMKGLSVIEQLFVEDMESKDRMQGEMLRSLLKCLLIKVTRVARKQMQDPQPFKEDNTSLIRKFNLLLETHYKEEHEVSFYAQALHKSPKTLSNLFNIFRYPSPSRLIHHRLILEAKRYLYYTDKTAKEIAYELGFANPAHFSRFFKLKTGTNISHIRGAAISIQ